MASAVCAMPLAAPAPIAVAMEAQSLSGADSSLARRQRMQRVDNWGYWLSSFDVASVAEAPHDLMVIDSEISASRSFERDYSAQEVARMKQRPDGGSRLLLAYLSIGEAERYRPYWQADWNEVGKRPDWLGKENSRWAGNYAVQFWRPQWQRLLFGEPESYLDRILAQGFDGIYLDRADAFFQWRKTNPAARSDMGNLIARLGEYARARQPPFIVVMQNAEELLEEAAVLNAIDGIAKEDLLYGVRRAQEPNKPADVDWSLEMLHMAQKAERKVLVVEYLKDPDKMLIAAKRIRAEGFIPYFAPRRLHCLNPPAVLDAAGILPDHSCH
jgi:cysteinyl-tRNA synthetase